MKIVKKLCIVIFMKNLKQNLLNLIIKGIFLKWKKIYTLMHRIQMKLELFLNQIVELKNTNTKTRIN